MENIEGRFGLSTITRQAGLTVLRGIPYDLYVRLRDLEENWGYRMTYYDGTLEILSPEYIHEFSARRFDMMIRAAVFVFAIPTIGAGSTTFRRAGETLKKGKGKEPDTSFYFTRAAQIAGLTTINLDVDPPPELWVEVDNRGSSRGKLPVYAGLGVPEVWRYRPRSGRLWFGRLIEGSYQEIDRSLALPMLTPADVLQALAACGVDETAWDRWLRESWAPSLTRP